MSVADDFVRERAALWQTLTDLGPEAPTACGDWVTEDLAVHVAMGEMFGGWPTVPFRAMVNRGIRVDRMARANAAALRVNRRRGFDWALRRLGRKPPQSHMLGPVVAVSLMEVWAHHEDVLLANGLTCASGVDLAPVIDLLKRYQRKSLEGVDLSGHPAEVARRLAGRTPESGLKL